jgi:hypothetical protein
MVNPHAAAEDMQDRISKMKAYHNDRKQETPLDKDNMLMQPMENWDYKDRAGTMGQAIYVFPGSRKYQENYDRIDWSK